MVREKSQPDKKDTHLQPEITSLSQIETNATKSPRRPYCTLPGRSQHLLTRTRTHNRTLRPVSLSFQEMLSFFLFFFVFFFLLFFPSFFERDLFFFSIEGYGMIVRGDFIGGVGEVLVRGVPRCCSPSAPGKEREKEGEFFFCGWFKKMDTNSVLIGV